MSDTERTLAVFIDFENLAIGFKRRRGDFDIQQDPRAAAGEGQDHRQEGLRRLERVQAVHQAAARGGHRAHRDPPAQHDRQELGRHPPGGGRHGPGLVEGAHRHLRDRVGRLRLLAPGLEAQGERQAHHRHRHEGLHLRPAGRATATSSSSTKIWRRRPRSSPPPPCRPMFPRRRRKCSTCSSSPSLR